MDTEIKVEIYQINMLGFSTINWTMKKVNLQLVPLSHDFGYFPSTKWIGRDKLPRARDISVRM